MSKPILIYEGGGSNPHIIGIIDTGKYADHDSKAMSAIINKRVNNISTLEVVIPANCTASRTITYTSDLVVYDTDGKIQEFHITDLEDVEEYSVERTIYAEQTLGELINDIILGTIAMPTTKNPADYLGYILSFTRWTVGTIDSSIYNSQWRQDLVGLNCLQALQLFIEKYNCEFEPRYVTDNKNKIIGRYLDIKKTIGHNYGKRFEDDKDITKIKRNLNLDGIKTAIYPRIAKNATNEAGENVTEYVDISNVEWSVANGDPVDKPLGQAILVNKDIDNLYKRYNTKTGKLMDRIMYAEWTEQTAENAESLCKQAWNILKMNSVLTPSIEVNASDLYRMSSNNADYQHEQVALGDTCIIIAKQFNPAIRITTRVMEMEEDLLNPVNNKFVFGKYRRTLATSNLDQQNSVEQKINNLQDKIQGIKIPEIPEYTLPYQSGKIPYEQVKEQIQNGFIAENGYVMAEDSNGFWVFDKPVGEQPTKALILKGGCLGIATYNTITSSWEVGTFINGTSVNADYINSGHINTDLLAAGSISAEHLSVAAQEYLKTGLATEDDLQSVVDSVAENYPTKTSVTTQITDAVNNATSDLVSNDALTNAINGLALDAKIVNTKIDAIQQAFNAITTEYENNSQQATSLYSNPNLTGTPKTNLNNAKNDYTNKYNALKNAVKDIVDNTDISNAKLSAYNTAITALQSSTKILGQRVQEAIEAISDKIYANSKQYADDLKIDIETDIEEVNVAVTNLNNTMIGSFKDGIIDTAEAKAIASNISILSAEKADVDYEYNTLYANTNLKGNPKTNLKNKKDAFNTAYANLVNAINVAIADDIVTSDEQDSIDSALTAYNTAIGNYRSATQTAIEAIATDKVSNATANLVSTTIMNTAISNATDGLATEIFVNNAVDTGKAQAEMASRVKALQEFQRQLKIEYVSNKAKADKIYADTYLPAGSTAKTGLNNAITEYTTAYNTYYNHIDTMLSDNNITTAEYNTFVTNSDNYSAKLKNLAEAMEIANNARLANVYAQARQGLVTTAELEVNNQSVIASAKAGMVSTGDMTSAISFATQDLVSTSVLNTAIDGVQSENIHEVYNSIKAEYNNNYKLATTLYANSYLTGTAKTNLQTAYNDYNTKFNAVTTAHNNIYSSANVTEASKTAWNTAITNLQTSTTTLAQRIQEAQTYINTAVYNASKNYTDTAIPDALTGYAKTTYVDTAKQQAIADAKAGMVSTSQLEVNNTEILMTTAKMGQYNLLKNTDFRDGTSKWGRWHNNGSSNVTGATALNWQVLQNTTECMAGEKALNIYINRTATGMYGGVVYQEVKLTTGVTYTVSQWTAAHRCSMKVNILSYDSSNNMTGLANKVITSPKSGGTQRANWDYTSLTFTVPSNSAKVKVEYAIWDCIGNDSSYLWIVKPMLCTGINAQPWTAHPDEIHIGIVSVTEEKGIMVEHSDSNTYSTLSATGLKIWEHDKNTPIASFGEGNSAYIGTLSTDKIVSNTVTPTIQLTKDITIYYSNAGSGNYDGSNNSNCATGFTGAMRVLCNTFDIDNTHVNGNFILKSVNPTQYRIKFVAVGTVLNEGIFLENISGSAVIEFNFPANMVQSGLMFFNNIQLYLDLNGNRGDVLTNTGCLLKRDANNLSIQDGIVFKHCSNVHVNGFRIISTQNDSYSGISFYQTTGSIRYVDVYNFSQAIWLNYGSMCYTFQVSGTSRFCGINLRQSIWCGNGAYPRGTEQSSQNNWIYDVRCGEGSYRLSDGNKTGTWSCQASTPQTSVTSQSLTQSFTPNKYQSVRQYTISDLYQAAWNGSGGYGEYVGQIYFGDTLKNFLNGATNISAQIYLHRRSSQHGIYSGAKVKIDGSDVGTLDLGQAKWFTVPAATLTKLQNGSLTYIPLNGTGNAYYIQFEKDVTLKVTCTKSI